MTIKRWLPAVALALLFVGAGRSSAGSFLGPCCYGAAYAQEFPGRAHHVYGCGPCCPCQAWHPLFPHLRQWLHGRKGPDEPAPEAAQPGCPAPALTPR